MQEQQEQQQPELKLYKRRWLFLFAIGFLNLLQAMCNLLATQVNNIYVIYFRETYAAVDEATIGGYLGQLPVSFVAAWLVYSNQAKVRALSITCATLQTFAFALMVLGFVSRRLFALVVIGQLIQGARNAFSIALIPALTVQWFSINEVGTTYAAYFLGSSIGVLLGCLLPSHVMLQPPPGFSNAVPAVNGSDDWLMYDRDAALLLYGVPFVLSLVVLVLFVFYSSDRPPTPPSLVQGRQVEEENDLQEKPTLMGYIGLLKAVYTNRSFLSTAVLGAVVLHINTPEYLMMSQITRRMLAGTDVNADVIGSYAVTIMASGSVAAAPISAWLVNRFKKYVIQIRAGSLLCVLASVGLLLSVYFRNIAGVYACNFTSGFAVRLVIVPTIEVLTQSTFPIKEAFVGSLYGAIMTFDALLNGLLGRMFFNTTGSLGLLSYISALFLLVFVLSWLLNLSNKRSEAEDRLIAEQARLLSD